MILFHYCRYRPGNGDILLTNVQCVETDNHILRCSTAVYSTFDSCTHTDDIGIRCGKYMHCHQCHTYT